MLTEMERLIINEIRKADKDNLIKTLTAFSFPEEVIKMLSSDHLDANEVLL